MNWIASLVRVAGASFPLASSLVQLQSEIDSRTTQERLRRLEDPISTLHPDVNEVSRLMYDAVKSADSTPLTFPDSFYSRYARVLAMLEARGYIRGQHSLTDRFAAGLWISDPDFFAYMCALHEEPAKMDALVQRIEEGEPGRWLNGSEIARDLHVPLPVVRAIFQIYEARGLGILSKEIGTANYLCRA